MSDTIRIALIGATGLIGTTVIGQCIGREDVRLMGIARREMKLPRGIRMELFVAEPAKWGEVIEAIRPTALICALGTTWKKAGEEEAAFRAVDHDLVLETAQAARKLNVERFVHVSSAGADPMSGKFYLKVKGEVERELTKMRFGRLDILRPGLLIAVQRNGLVSRRRLWATSCCTAATVGSAQSGPTVSPRLRLRLQSGRRGAVSSMTMTAYCAQRRRYRRSNTKRVRA